MAHRHLRSHQDYLVQSLKDPQEACAYLGEFFRDDGDEDHQTLVCQAIRNVIKAHGFAQVAKSAGIGRESLYKSFADDANPRIGTLLKVLQCLGFDLSVTLKPARKASHKATTNRKPVTLAAEAVSTRRPLVKPRRQVASH